MQVGLWLITEPQKPGAIRLARCEPETTSPEFLDWVLILSGHTDGIEIVDLL